MAVHIGSAGLKEAYVGATPVEAIYVGAVQVWSRKPTVVISGSRSAQRQLRDAITAYGLDYTTVEELPFNLDTTQVTYMGGMFRDCRALTTVPDMDTSQVTNMRYMFSQCSALTSVPDMDTSQVTDMRYMFSQCSALTHVPDMDTSQVTNIESIFWGCSALTDGNVRLICRDGIRPRERFGMLTGSGLTREPFYDSNLTPI